MHQSIQSRRSYHTDISEYWTQTSGKPDDTEAQAMERAFIVSELRRIADYLEGDAFDSKAVLTILHSVEGSWNAGSTVFFRLDVGP